VNIGAGITFFLTETRLSSRALSLEGTDGISNLD
jgi:hypothetical protein